uniref:Uncharacterized protein n=1 Tax=Leersia perrieri TaxID=77586 RepID=A0A0D9WDA2_9ORYZ
MLLAAAAVLPVKGPGYNYCGGYLQCILLVPFSFFVTSGHAEEAELTSQSNNLGSYFVHMSLYTPAMESKVSYTPCHHLQSSSIL